VQKQVYLQKYVLSLLSFLLIIFALGALCFCLFKHPKDGHALRTGRSKKRRDRRRDT